MERSEKAGQVGQVRLLKVVLGHVQEFNYVLWGTLVDLGKGIVLVIEVCLLDLEFWVCHFLAL